MGFVAVQLYHDLGILEVLETYRAFFSVVFKHVVFSSAENVLISLLILFLEINVDNNYETKDCV